MRRPPGDPFDEFFKQLEQLMSEAVEEHNGNGRLLGLHADVQYYNDRVVAVFDLTALSDVDKNDIDVQCTDRQLVLTIGRPKQTITKKVSLPHAVEEESAHAKFNNGILTIEFTPTGTPNN